jgi:hypothetical protein
MAITVPVRTAERRAKTVRVDLFVAAVFRELQICRLPAAAKCSVSSRLTVHKNREPRYEFANLSSGDVRQSRIRFPSHRRLPRHG